MDTSIVISILTAVGFGSILTAVIQYVLEQRRESRRLLFEARRVAYGEVLRELRSRSHEDDTLDLQGILSEATLLAGQELREKLVKAANAFPEHWLEIYGMDKASALKDIELEMKKELGIKN